jgi:acyl-CoA synthetase (NDP forming)
VSSEVLERFAPLFRPRSIAVVGASAAGVTPGNEFIRHSLALGYEGRIFPLHPKADTVEGLRCWRSFEEIGNELCEPVDYAYIAIAAGQVAPLLQSAAGRLRYAQVMSSGFGETPEGREREILLLAAARSGGIRVLGPNCLGVHSPRGGITFVGGAAPEPGSIGIASQSGGLAVDMILRGGARGLRFSGLATLGNSVDLGPADLLEFYLADPETRAVGCYVEDVKNGRAFFEALRQSRGAKPVVLLVGGRTPQGQQAAASHTGSLASDARIWDGLARQTGAVLVDTLDEFLNALVAFQALAPRDDATTSAVLFGNGGGTSVLAADAFARAGIAVAPMPGEAIERLAALALPPGTSIVNPIDTPAGTLRVEEGRVAERILAIVFEHARPDAIVMHLNLPVFITSTDQRADVVGNLMQAALRVTGAYPGRAHFVLVLRSDGSAASDERKRRCRDEAARLGIPAFDEMADAAKALAALGKHERHRARRRKAASA